MFRVIVLVAALVPPNIVLGDHKTNSIIACSGGSAARVAHLLHQVGDADPRAQYGSAVPSIGADSGHVEAAQEFLLEKLSNPPVGHKVRAGTHSWRSSVEFPIVEGATITTSNSRIGSALGMGAALGLTQTPRLLIAQGDGNQIEARVASVSGDTRAATRQLAVAAEIGDVGSIRELLAQGAAINECLPRCALDEAIRGGHVDAVRVLVEAGATVGARGQHSDHHPLVDAVDSGRVAIAQVLLEHGADPDVKDGLLVAVPLISAALIKAREARLFANTEGKYADYVEIFHQLVAHNADVNVKGVKRDKSYHEAELSPLMYAVDEDMFDDAALLVSKGADINAKSGFGQTAIMFAQSGKMATLLISHSAEVNSIDNNGQTPLMHASFITTAPPDMRFEDGYGRFDVVQILLEAHSEINARDKFGNTALQYANEKQNAAIALLLKKAGAKGDVALERVNLDQQLYYACRRGHKKAVELLLDAGAGINSHPRQPSGMVEDPLAVAVRYGNLEVVALLLEKGAEVNPNDNRGDPLLIAVREGSRSMTEVLLAGGAKPEPGHLKAAILRPSREIAHILMRAGVSMASLLDDVLLLAEAVKSGEPESVRLLLECGFDPNKSVIVGYPNAKGVLLYSIERRTDAITDLLLSAKADVNLASWPDGVTPLMAAARWGNAGLIQSLLSRGAKVNLRSGDGKTALSYANGKDVVEILKKAGAKK